MFLYTRAGFVLFWVAFAAMVPRGSAVELERAQAFVGKPFGVGSVDIRLSAEEQPTLGPAGLRLTAEGSRVLYPAVGQPLLRGIIRSALDRPGRATVFFLFTGAEPLELTIHAGRASRVAVTPQTNTRMYGRELRAWWREYSGTGKLLKRDSDCPALVDDYLQAVLARRLRLPIPQRRVDKSWLDQFTRELVLAGGTDGIRRALVRDRMLGRAPLGQSADQPLPAPIRPVPLDLPELPDDVQIEPIASRVPAEFLYVRFGSFSNFLWMQDTLAEWKGDLQNLVGGRGLDHGLAGRMEEQLVVRQSPLARLLGDAAIADVALVGTDAFFREGAAYGLLLQAQKLNPMLATDLLRQRVERVSKNDGVTEEKLTLAGREVSFLSSPDGRVRSFYVADGSYHFVTSSRVLARRFVEVARGAGSLGSSDCFRQARLQMPVDRKDTVFVYLSDAFLQNLVSPKYRVELARRMQALVDIQLVQLARLAAKAEGQPSNSIEQLTQDGFLPGDFGRRPDGSRTVLQGDNVHDSRRGRHGYFVPVPDVDVQRVTPAEAAEYAQFAAYYRDKWQRLDPIVVGIQRTDLGADRQKLVIDAHVSPLAKRKYDLLRQIVGEPEDKRLAAIQGDVASLEVIFPFNRRFAGLRDTQSGTRNPISVIFPAAGILELLVAYVGTNGEIGFLGFLDDRIEGLADISGYAGDEGGLWRRTVGDFTVFSFYRDVLEEVTPQLRYVQAERPGQVWLSVGDISDAQLTPLVNRLGYRKSRKTTEGNLLLLHAFAQQLGVPGGQCKATAEALLDAALVCPLGGQYVYVEGPAGAGSWTSTALEGRRTGLRDRLPPAGYRAPVVTWLRGLNADLLLEPDNLSLHAELEMRKRAGSAD